MSPHCLNAEIQDGQQLLRQPCLYHHLRQLQTPRQVGACCGDENFAQIPWPPTKLLVCNKSFFAIEGNYAPRYSARCTTTKISTTSAPATHGSTCRSAGCNGYWLSRLILIGQSRPCRQLPNSSQQFMSSPLLGWQRHNDAPTINLPSHTPHAQQLRQPQSLPAMP